MFQYFDRFTVLAMKVMFYSYFEENVEAVKKVKNILDIFFIVSLV